MGFVFFMTTQLQRAPAARGLGDSIRSSVRSFRCCPLSFASVGSFPFCQQLPELSPALFPSLMIARKTCSSHVQWPVSESPFQVNIQRGAAASADCLYDIAVWFFDEFSCQKAAQWVAEDSYLVVGPPMTVLCWVSCRVAGANGLCIAWKLSFPLSLVSFTRAEKSWVGARKWCSFLGDSRVCSWPHGEFLAAENILVGCLSVSFPQ